MDEAIKAIDLHLKCLKQDFESLVNKTTGRKTDEYKLALETIKKKMIECERAREVLTLINSNYQ